MSFRVGTSELSRSKAKRVAELMDEWCNVSLSQRLGGDQSIEKIVVVVLQEFFQISGPSARERIFKIHTKDFASAGRSGCLELKIEIVLSFKSGEWKIYLSVDGEPEEYVFFNFQLELDKRVLKVTSSGGVTHSQKKGAPSCIQDFSKDELTFLKKWKSQEL